MSSHTRGGGTIPCEGGHRLKLRVLNDRGGGGEVQIENLLNFSAIVNLSV